MYFINVLFNKVITCKCIFKMIFGATEFNYF